MKHAILALCLILCSSCSSSPPANGDAESWKKKFIEEVNFRYQHQTHQTRDSERAAYEIELKNRAEMIAMLHAMIAELEKKLEDKK